MNRSKYSYPEDVIRDGKDEPESYWVLAWQIGQIPAEIHPINGGKKFNVVPTHVPVHDNYAHSELRAFPEGSQIEGEPSPLQRSLFRQAMAEIAQVSIEPGDSFPVREDD